MALNNHSRGAFCAFQCVNDWNRIQTKETESEKVNNCTIEKACARPHDKMPCCEISCMGGAYLFNEHGNILHPTGVLFQ